MGIRAVSYTHLIKNIGEKFIQQLMQERSENGPFTGFEEFCRRMAGKELGRRAVESLIRSGAFDSLGVKRRALMQMVDACLLYTSRCV